LQLSSICCLISDDWIQYREETERTRDHISFEICLISNKILLPTSVRIFSCPTFRADDATQFLDVIRAAEIAGVYHDLVKYLLTESFLPLNSRYRDWKQQIDLLLRVIGPLIAFAII